MTSSATAANPTDPNNTIGIDNKLPSNLKGIVNSFENKLNSSEDSGQNFQTSTHMKSQVLPVVYIQAPTKLPLVTISKSNSTNVIVKSVPPIHLSNLTSANPKPSPSITVPSNQSVLISNANNPLKSQPQQIVIHKSGGISNAYLTMIKPVSNYGETVQTNQIHIPTTTSAFVQTSVGQKVVITPISNGVQNLTETTNTVQPKLAFVPLTIQPNANETNTSHLINFKIADGKLQSKSVDSPITVMCDSHNSPENSNNENKLICTEIIDLDSPVKEEKSPSPSLEIKIEPPELDECNFSNSQGVSILKKSFPFDLIQEKGVMVTKPSTGTEETVILTEQKVLKKQNRRKSNFSFRKDFDDISIEFCSNTQQDNMKSLNENDISLTKAENDFHSVKVKTEEENDVEIKIIRDNNMNDDFDIHDMIKWDNNVGKLPGSSLRFMMNEFNVIEYLPEEEHNKASKTKDKSKDEFPEEMICIECGCFGLPSDFISPKYCSYDCQDTSKQKKLELKHKEKEKFKKRKRAIIRKAEEKMCIKEQSESSDASNNENSRDKFTYPWNCAKKGFSWAKYLEHTKTKAAPTKLFKDAFPFNRNMFKPGMKLEGIDPSHPSYFCVLTVAEVHGYRMRLHFDGYSANYDFWTNADSMNIFPMGWCEKYGHSLHPPPGYTEHDFNWLNYLKETKSTAAPKQLFANRAGNAICPNGFRVGMKLEAVDKKNNSSLVCVATVRDMMDNRILVHFDSWNDIYDYWAEPTSPYIHPVGWCDQSGHKLTPPNDYPFPEQFTWDTYLRETKAVPAPVRAFKQKPACGFKKGMKLECVDKRLPHVIRVATVDDVNGHQIKIRFDGWVDKYSYWVDDDCPDIHPAGWCQKTGHHIEPPLTPDDVYDFLECRTIGCRGLGHSLGAELPTHSSLRYCPYAEGNYKKTNKLPDRLLNPIPCVETVVPVSREPKEKPKARLGRPPKFAVKLEVKSEAEEDECEMKQAPKRYKRTEIDNIDEGIESRIMDFLNDIQENPTEKEAWQRHSKFLNNYTEFTNDPRKWSRTQVAHFIESLPTGSDYANVFKNHEIDGEALLLLSQRDIMDLLNIKLGPAVKLYNSIVLLRHNLRKNFNFKK